MKLTINSQRQFVLEGVKFSERNVPREAGFTWHPELKTWYSERPKAAVRLREYADDHAKKVIERLTISYEPWSGPLPFAGGLTPRPHQFEAAKFALSRNRSYLGLAPRLGKTAVAAMIYNALDLHDHATAVYIAPPFLTRTVEAELANWVVGYPHIARYEPKELPAGLPDILIVPDSQIHRPGAKAAIEELAGENSLLIVDEAHRFKNPEAVRTKALFGTPRERAIVDGFARQVYLSGTPMPNRPIELYPVLSKVAPETIDYLSYTSFGLKYCDGRLSASECPKCRGKGAFTFGRSCPYCQGAGRFTNGYDFSGASNLEELQANVHGKFMLRMRTAPGLPAKIEDAVIIGDAPAKLVALERKLLRDASPEDLIKGTVSSDHLSIYRRELGSLKVKPALEFIRSILEETNEAVLVFAFHKDVIAGLTKGLQDFKPFVIDGSVPMAARKKITEDFQSDPKRRVVILNYVAGGLGLKLAKASRVIMVEYSWVPGENDQASDRAQEIGGEELYVQYLVFQNSIDRTTIETNLRKRKITALI